MHLTPNEFLYAIRDRQREQEGEFDRFKYFCDVLRVMLVRLYNKDKPVREQLKKATDFIELVWDKDRIKAQTAEDMKKMAKFISLATSVVDQIKTDKQKHIKKRNGIQSR